MTPPVTAKDIEDFETSIAEAFNRGEIRSPVHLDNGNEAALVEIFKTISSQDWVCGTWRMHAKCLLHGVSPERLRAEISAGRSISLYFPDRRIISSAIVGGILPIAVGIAMGIKRDGGSERVHVFLGDMTSQGGMFYECHRYSMDHGLPIRFIVEDNGVSVCTPTAAAWGKKTDQRSHLIEDFFYRSKYPHAGAGVRVQF
jgi:TPP-dependent pyruvate/acetoin dehydrogenase alpha subunit